MVWRIITHEWRNLRADRSLWLLAALFTLIIGYGIYNGRAWAQSRQELAGKLAPKTQSFIKEFKMRLAQGLPPPPNSGVRDLSSPYSVSTQYWDVLLPPTPLAALSVGQSDLYPGATQARMWSTPDKLFAQSEPQNPVNLQAGRFDLAFVVIYLFPLLILALGYNLLSAEKEEGTLALLLSQSASLSQVVIGKAIARVVLLSGFLIIVSLIGISIAGARFAGPVEAAQLSLWIAVVMTYGLFWQTLSVLVNLWNRGSATNALILAGVWLALVIVVPSLVNSATALLYPIPPRAELIIADRDAEPNVKRDGQRVLSRFYEDHPELRPAATEAEVGVFRRMLLTVFLANQRAYEPLARRYDIQLQRQQALVDYLRFLTPAAATHEPINDLSGSGFMRYRRFRAQVNGFIERQREFFVPKVMRDAKMTVADYDALPVFRYEEEPLAEMGRRVMKSLAGLIIWVGLCAAAAAVKLRGYSVAGTA